MLLVLLLGPEKNDPELKEIHAQAHVRVCMDFLPGLFHTGAPVDIVKDKDRAGVFFGKGHVKITEGRLVGMVAVKIHEIHAFQG